MSAKCLLSKTEKNSDIWTNSDNLSPLEPLKGTRKRAIKNQTIFHITQALYLPDGTLLDPAGGRGGEHAAPFPSSAPHLLATFSSYPPLLLLDLAPALCPVKAWPGLLLPPRKEFVGPGQ